MLKLMRRVRVNTKRLLTKTPVCRETRPKPGAFPRLRHTMFEEHPEPTTFTRLRQALFEKHPEPRTFLRLRHTMFKEHPRTKYLYAPAADVVSGRALPKEP